MDARRTVSRLFFAAGCILWVVALGLVIAARVAPSNDGFRDLARFVGGMLLAAFSIAPFAICLLVGRGTRMPRWMLVVSWAGIALASVPAVAFLLSWADQARSGI